MIYLTCTICKTKVTNIISHCGDDQIWNRYADFIETDFIDRGSYFRNPNGDYILNLEDKTNLDYHPDPARIQGCCGPSDSEEPNLICKTCKSEIGREIEDCIFPHFLRLCASKVGEVSDQWDLFHDLQKCEREQSHEKLLLQFHQLVVYSSPKEVQTFISQQIRPALS